jgi:hypothetical protein
MWNAELTPHPSPDGDTFLVSRLGQIAKRLPLAICDPQGEGLIENN